MKPTARRQLLLLLPPLLTRRPPWIRPRHRMQTWARSTKRLSAVGHPPSCSVSIVAMEQAALEATLQLCCLRRCKLLIHPLMLTACCRCFQ